MLLDITPVRAQHRLPQRPKASRHNQLDSHLTTPLQIIARRSLLLFAVVRSQAV
jgi:hypothetical protein